MSKISVRTADAFKVLEKRLEEGEQKKRKDLVIILKDEFKGINDSQCSGIIHRAHANPDAVLKKEGSNYRLLTDEEKPETAEGLDLVREKLAQFIEEVENIPAAQFQTYDTFSKYKEFLDRLQQIKHI